MESALEMAVGRFQAIQGIHQLESKFSQFAGVTGEWFGRFDREPDSVKGNTVLIGHFIVQCRGRHSEPGFDCLENLIHEFGTHPVTPSNCFSHERGYCGKAGTWTLPCGRVSTTSLPACLFVRQLGVILQKSVPGR